MRKFDVEILEEEVPVEMGSDLTRWDDRGCLNKEEIPCLKVECKYTQQGGKNP